MHHAHSLLRAARNQLRNSYIQIQVAPSPATEETLVSEEADAFFLFALCTLLALLPLRSAHTSMSMACTAAASRNQKKFRCNRLAT
jgi:hypothetical protein